MSVQQRRTAVVIPVYRAPYLAECLASVFAQSLPPDEVIVVDDGSPDPQAILTAVGPYGDRVRVLRQENQGAGAARNRGILAAGSPLIAFLDADDVWEPELLQIQQGLLARGATLVYANATYVGDPQRNGQLFMDTAPSAGEVTLDALLSQRCTVLTSSVVVERQALLDVGLFDESLRRGQDFDLWVRLAAAGAKIAFTTRALARRRIHADNLSGDRIAELERALAVFSRLSSKLSLTPAQLRIIDHRRGRLSAEIASERGKRTLAAGALAEAAAHFRAAARAGAGWKSHLVHLALQIAPASTRYAYLRLRGAADEPSLPTA